MTVFEECDADKAIAELNRVLKPGGRAGVIIRSRDLSWYWNVDVSEEIKAKINVPDSEAGHHPEAVWIRASTRVLLVISCLAPERVLEHHD